VRQAVTVLGTRRLFEIVASSAFSKVIPDHIPGYDVDARAFWLHCVAVAVLGERVAGEMKQRAPELTFTAGLLHDVGKIVIGSFLDESSQRVASRMETEGLSFLSAEREVLMTDHTEIGAELASRWHLPEGVLMAARFHHQPNDVPEGVDQTLVDVIHVADGLAHMIGFGADIGGLKRRMEPAVVERLGLEPESMDRVTSIALDEIHAVALALNPDR
jgi:putative nucleotidyltransferase with HDIG domain